MITKKLKIVLIPLYCFLLTSCNHTNYKPIGCPYELKQLYMCTANSAWGLSFDNEILFTDNGLENFKLIRTFENVNGSTDGYANAAFINEESAYVTYFSSDNEYLIVESTRDCGNSWQQLVFRQRNSL